MIVVRCTGITRGNRSIAGRTISNLRFADVFNGLAGSEQKLTHYPFQPWQKTNLCSGGGSCHSSYNHSWRIVVICSPQQSCRIRTARHRKPLPCMTPWQRAARVNLHRCQETDDGQIRHYLRRVAVVDGVICACSCIDKASAAENGNYDMQTEHERTRKINEWCLWDNRMSFSSDQVTGTVFPHLNMPFLPNSKFI